MAYENQYDYKKKKVYLTADSSFWRIGPSIARKGLEEMKYTHTNRPGFLLGLIDFFTAGLFFLIYMPLGGLQNEIDEILGHRTLPYWKAYLLGIPTLFIYPLMWMARIAEELKSKAIALGVEAPYTSWWHMFGWNTFGLLLFGPAVATHRFFETLNRVEAELNRRETDGDNS